MQNAVIYMIQTKVTKGGRFLPGQHLTTYQRIGIVPAVVAERIVSDPWQEKGQLLTGIRKRPKPRFGPSQPPELPFYLPDNDEFSGLRGLF